MASKWPKYALLVLENTLSKLLNRQGGGMSRGPTSRFGRSGNLKIAGSSLQPTGSKPGQVKSSTLKLILVAAWHY